MSPRCSATRRDATRRAVPRRAALLSDLARHKPRAPTPAASPSTHGSLTTHYFRIEGNIPAAFYNGNKPPLFSLSSLPPANYGGPSGATPKNNPLHLSVVVGRRLPTAARRRLLQHAATSLYPPTYLPTDRPPTTIARLSFSSVSSPFTCLFANVHSSLAFRVACSASSNTEPKSSAFSSLLRAFVCRIAR